MPPRLPDESWVSYTERLGFPPTEVNVRRIQHEADMHEIDAVNRERVQTGQSPMRPVHMENGLTGWVASPGVNEENVPPSTTANPTEFFRESLSWQIRNNNAIPRNLRGSLERIIEDGPVIPDAPMSPPRELTNELEVLLDKARHKIDMARERRLAEMSQNQGRREGQYMQIVFKQKREALTPSDIVASELPIGVEVIGHRKLNEIVKLHLCQDIRAENNDARIEFRCARCGLNTPSVYAYFCHGRMWCAEHVPELERCNVCGNLGEGNKKVHTYDDRDILACANCLAHRNRCGCGKPLGPEYVEVRMCPQCIDHRQDSAPYRNFGLSMKWVGTAKGAVMQSNRVFSCEVEALSPLHDWMGYLYKPLPKEFGIGNDGSVKGNGERYWGFEVQSPRLAGKKGEEGIQRMYAALKSVKAIVNQTCGMHVHLDGKGILVESRKDHPTALLQLWKTYIVFEDVILSLLPFSRRRNDFCRPLGEAFQITELESIESFAEAEKLWYKERTYHDIESAKGHRYHASRYFGANFHSLFADGHFEVRFHSATMKPQKILEWANLHALIMDACTNKVMTLEFMREAMATSRLSEKTALLFDRIGLAETSRQFYYARQRKFGEKKNDDEEIHQPKVKAPRPLTSVSARPRVRLPLITPQDLARQFEGLVEDELTDQSI